MALIPISGHLFDSTGTPITNANVRFQLTNFGANITTVTGTNVVVPTTVLLVTNSSGLYSGSIQGNDTITPTGTVYQVSFASSLTAQYIFTGSSPISLDSYPPATVIPVPPAPVPTNILTVITANYSPTMVGGTILCNSASAIAITLPQGVSYAGAEWVIKNINTGTVTINPASGSVDGAANFVNATQYQSNGFRSDGTNYWIT